MRVRRGVQESKAADISFPCVCRMIPTAVFNSRNPIVIGMDVLEGSLRVGTPLCVLQEGRDPVRPASIRMQASLQRPLRPGCAHVVA